MVGPYRGKSILAVQTPSTISLLDWTSLRIKGALGQTPMNLEILALIGIILFALVAFVREWLPMDAVSLTCLGLLLLFGLVTPEEAIAGFSNPAVITVMMMFILSAGLVDTGTTS